MLRLTVAHRPNGERLPVSTTAAPIRDEREQIIAFVIVVRNIAEERKSASALQHSKKMQAVGRLAGGIAHEFSNLLTVIGGVSDLMLTEAGLPASARGDLETIQAAARRAALLTRQLLTLSGRHRVQPQVFDLGATLRDMKASLTRLAGTDVRVAIQIPEPSALIKADPAEIERAIIELVTNARDAMPGGGQITITARTPNDGESRTVVLEVADTGTGMSAEILDHLFEPFFTTKEVGQGTGLGLASVYGTIARAGGRIEVESAVGTGSRFSLIFPDIDAAPPESRSDPHNQGAHTKELT